jgi:hypothetical protein
MTLRPQRSPAYCKPASDAEGHTELKLAADVARTLWRHVAHREDGFGLSNILYAVVDECPRIHKLM